MRAVLLGYVQSSHAERCTFASSTSSEFRDALGRCTLLRDILIAAINSDGNTHAHRLIKQKPSFSSTTLLAITPTSQKGIILFGYPVAHRSISHLFLFSSCSARLGFFAASSASNLKFDVHGERVAFAFFITAAADTGHQPESRPCFSSFVISLIFYCAL